jgi:hypothetical protein
VNIGSDKPRTSTRKPELAQHDLRLPRSQTEKQENSPLQKHNKHDPICGSNGDDKAVAPPGRIRQPKRLHMVVYDPESGDADREEVQEPKAMNVNNTTNDANMNKTTNPELIASNPNITSPTEPLLGTPIEHFFAKIEINAFFLTRHPLSTTIYGIESELSTLIDKKFSASNPFNDYAAYVLDKIILEWENGS